MNKLFQSPKAKIIIDILLFIGIVGLGGTGKTWSSPHCIGASIWLVLMLLHIAQHWQHTKSFARWSVIRKNMITALTIFAYALMLSSVLLFIFDFKDSFIAFHHVAGRLFLLIITLHVINKFKQFKSLFKKKRINSKLRSEI